jgi:hypothetical protein
MMSRERDEQGEQSLAPAATQTDTHLDARIARLRLLTAATWPATYQSIPADIEALLREYDRLRAQGDSNGA